MNINQEMQKAITSLEQEYHKISTGRANPIIFQNLIVEAYGDRMSLLELASIQVSDARQLIIKPYDKNTIKSINQAINAANLRVTVQDDGDKLRVNFPELNEEKRKELIKEAKQLAENYKVQIRNIRRNANDFYKKQELSENELKIKESQVQDATDTFIKKIEQIFEEKSKTLSKI